MKSSGIIGTIFKVLLPVVIIAAGLGITGVLSALKTEPVKNDEPLRAAAVFVEAAELVDYTQAVESQGEVRPQREIIIAPQINGRIDWISDDYLVGSFVKKGQILARLEIQDFELAQIRAESTVAAARQALAREEAEAEVARQDIIDLGLSLEQASPLARREPQLAQARADLQGALASLKDAELALTRTAIVAPFDGVISEKTVDIGQFASPGSSLGRMFSIETFEVSLPITDTELGRIGLPLAFNETADRPGPEVIFTANVLGADRRWVGRVTRTDALINAQTRQINIFTELDDPYGAGRDGDTPMVPGLFVNASIDGITLPKVIKVPRDALRGADTVLVANEDETISVRKVDVAISNTSGAYLNSGIEPGEEVVISPVQAPFDGMNVQVLRRDDEGKVQVQESLEDAADDAVAEAGSGDTIKK